MHPCPVRRPDNQKTASDGATDLFPLPLPDGLINFLPPRQGLPQRIPQPRVRWRSPGAGFTRPSGTCAEDVRVAQRPGGLHASDTAALSTIVAQSAAKRIARVGAGRQMMPRVVRQPRITRAPVPRPARSSQNPDIKKFRSIKSTICRCRRCQPAGLETASAAGTQCGRRLPGAVTWMTGSLLCQ